MTANEKFWFTRLAGSWFAAIAITICLSVMLVNPLAAQTATPVGPAAAGNTPAAGQPTAAVSSYAINPGDEIEIYVWGEERLQRVMRVLPDGTVAFPLVGQMYVQGLYPQHVERQVSQLLAGQYRGQVPSVTVSIRSPAGMQFSVMGRVRAPGAFTTLRYINLLDALSLAGGPAEFANLDNVLLIRKQGNQLVTLRARLGPLFKVGASAADVDRANIVKIEAGDMVIVP